MAKTKSQARTEAWACVENYKCGNFFFGWLPGSTIFSAAGDQTMVRQIADCFGVKVFDMNTVKAHLGTVIGSSIGGGLAAEIAGWIPIIGGPIKACTLTGKAHVIGECVIDYFAEISPLP